MASTPADFRYGEEDVPKQEGWPTATSLIDEVMIPVCREPKLPLAMKLGARRGANPMLDPWCVGDGVKCKARPNPALVPSQSGGKILSDSSEHAEPARGDSYCAKVPQHSSLRLLVVLQPAQHH